MSTSLHRRHFLQRAAAGGAALAASGYFSSLPAAESKSPNEKLNIGCVGIMNRGADNVAGVESENIVALCDIDDKYLSAQGEKFSKARRYHDFRKLLEQSDVEAIVVSTPDHVHAPASAAAIRLGKHVYCEKPLTHTVREARTLADLAARHKVATQMGTQIHAEENYRRVVELIEADAIGPVREVHAWTGKGWGGGPRPTANEQIPANIHWDLWLGPAKERPYSHVYLPANWRRWWDFGNGTLGDMGCHLLDLAFWALRLRHPTSVSAAGPDPDPDTAPMGLVATWEFPARGALPPVKVIWYDGERMPKQVRDREVPGFGIMFIGDKGMLWADYGQLTLYPEKQYDDYQRPKPSIPKSVGHHREWINACKQGTPTSCNFDYSGALTETVLLGTIAYRTQESFSWDPAAFKTSSDRANGLLQRPHRAGWSV